MPRTVGVCSWSLQPKSPQELVERVAQIGCPGVQLHLDPLRDGWDAAQTATLLSDAGVRILSGMMGMEGEDYSTLDTIKATGGVRPDSTWQTNLDAANGNAALAMSLGITLVTFHAGWIPHEHADPERATMIERVRTIASVFADQGVRVALETGQETAHTLLEVLDELPEVGVNFDPANMILYGMGDPHKALETLGSRVAQLHIKDATPATEPGTWGTEVVVGTGAVDWARFFEIAGRVCPDADLLIEREAGEQRVADIKGAVEVIEAHAGVDS